MKEELKLDTYKSKSKSQLCAGVQKFRECRTSNKHEQNDAEMMLSGKSGDSKKATVAKLCSFLVVFLPLGVHVSLTSLQLCNCGGREVKATSAVEDAAPNPTLKSATVLWGPRK